MKVDADFAERFARAREEGADAIALDALAILDIEPEFAESWSENGGSRHRDSAHVSWLKNRFEGRLKLLSKWFPQKYGDKIGVEHQGGIALQVTSGVPDHE